jgi:hypothetical protein
MRQASLGDVRVNSRARHQRPRSAPQIMEAAAGHAAELVEALLILGEIVGGAVPGMGEDGRAEPGPL